ncbi:hypothetical protein BDZ89DRAFT_768983 [Hymenopellis radicata]|nr:hypothetical protein BDZ89DRAFT_768983 [Hymenopellis radicata]
MGTQCWRPWSSSMGKVSGCQVKSPRRHTVQHKIHIAAVSAGVQTTWHNVAGAPWSRLRVWVSSSHPNAGTVLSSCWCRRLVPVLASSSCPCWCGRACSGESMLNAHILVCKLTSSCSSWRSHPCWGAGVAVMSSENTRNENINPNHDRNA